MKSPRCLSTSDDVPIVLNLDNSLKFFDNFDGVNVTDVWKNTLTEDFIELNTSSPLDSCEQVEDKNRDSVDQKLWPKLIIFMCRLKLDWYKLIQVQIQKESYFSKFLLGSIPRKNSINISSLLSEKPSTTEPTSFCWKFKRQWWS